VISNGSFSILKLFLYINCWQHSSNLSTSAAALFDTVLIAQHIPQTSTAISDPEHHSASSSLHVPVSDDLLTPSSSSTFSDYWSCAESQNLDENQNLYCRQKLHSDDFLSEVESISSTECSALLEDCKEWPLVRVHDDYLPNPTVQRLSVTEDFVPELKPRAPVSHGLILHDRGKSWDTLTTRSPSLVKPGVCDFNCCEDNDAVLSDLKLPEKRKEITLYISKVECSMCRIEEIETFQKVVVAACSADKDEAVDGGGCLGPEDLVGTLCVEGSGYDIDRSHEATLNRREVEPEFSVTKSKDKDSCRSRLEVCQRDVGCSVAVQREMVGDVKYEISDIDNRLSVKLRDSRSHSAECLCEAKHSSHSVSQKAPQTSASNHSISTDEIRRVEESINRPEICGRDLGKYVDGYVKSVDHDTVADLNIDCKIPANSTHRLCWSEQDIRKSDQERLMKDISVSSESFSTEGNLVGMRDAPPSSTQHHSCGQLFPGVPDSLSYLDLYGRNVHRQLYQTKPLKPPSTDTVSTVRSLKSKKKLELTPPPNSTAVVHQTFVAHQSTSTPRVHYSRAASEPRRLSGIQPEWTSGNISNSNHAVRSLESKSSHSKYGKEDFSNVVNIHYAKRTLSDADLAVKYANEGSNYCDMNCHSMPDMQLVRQSAIQSDRSDGAHTAECSDEDADAMCERQSLGTCRLNVFSDARESTATEMKAGDCKYSRKTQEVCELTSTFAVTTKHTIVGLNDTLHSVSEISQSTISSPNDEVLLRTTPDAGDIADVAAPLEETIIDTSETATVNDVLHTEKAVSTYDTSARDPDNTTVGARKTLASDLVHSDYSDSVGNIVDSVTGTAADSSVSILATPGDVSSEVFSDTSISTAATPDNVASSTAETAASVSVPNSDCITEVIASDVIDSHLAHAGIPDDITVCGQTCQVIETYEERSARNSDEPDIIISSASNCQEEHTTAIAAEGDNWLVSDLGTAAREKPVESISWSDGVSHVPVRSNEVLANSSSITNSPSDVSLRSSDLSETLADSVTRPITDKYTNHSKADQQPVSTASDEVNHEQCLHVCHSLLAY